MSVQQIFMLAVDACLVIMLVIDFWMLVRNARHSKKDFHYEITKMLLEAEKDLHFVDCLGKLSDRIDVLEKLHDIDNSKKEDKDDE